MARTIHRLSATKLAALKTTGLYCDGGGLYFRIAGRSRGWIFRYGLHGKTHDMGCGAFPEISLASARKLAFAYRQMLEEGTDPLAERNAKRAAARVEDSKTITFDDCARQYIAAHADGWRNTKHRQQWTNTLAAYVSPVFGKLPVRAVDTGFVMRVLEPLWSSKPETASRLRGRIESILSWAQVRGYRLPNETNPAAWKNHLDHLLPAKSKVRKAEHHAALPYIEVGKFMHALRRQEGIAAQALEFTILTATRTSETLGALWSEVDTDARVWVIAANRTKTGKEHRVPLSDAAIAVLQTMRATQHSDYVFPGIRDGRPLSRTGLQLPLRRMGHSNVTVHGFRSTFRDWAAEQTAFPSEVAEMALAHTVGSEVERAYRRSDLFDKRRQLMDAWATFCATPSTPDSKIVPIGGARRK
jgi:integrase